MQIAIDRMTTIVNKMPLISLKENKLKLINLYFHIILQTEAELPDEEQQARFKKYLMGYIRAIGGVTPVIALAQNKVHILVGLEQTKGLAGFINELKLVSRIFARRRLKAQDFNWINHDEAFTVSLSQVDWVKRNIQRQTQLEKNAGVVIH
jgi:hypothetical protein